MRATSSRRLRSLLFLVALLVAWAGVTVAGAVSPLVLPRPDKVARALGTLVVEQGFLADFWHTARRALSALGLAMLLGIPLGLIFGHRGGTYAWFEGTIHGLRSVPATALFPLLLLIVGVSEATIVVFAAYPSLLVVLVSTVAGARLANRRRLHQAQLLGLGPAAMLREVLLFEALPHVFDGIRIAASYALVLVMAIEMFIGIGDSGIGRKIYDYQSTYRIPETWAAILAAALLGIALNGVVSLCERRLLRWLPEVHASDGGS